MVWPLGDREPPVLGARCRAFREDATAASATALAPLSMSLIKNAAMNTLRALKVPNITAALRENAKVPHLFHKLGITTK
ncbi:MAG: hypothetical protein R3B91_11900 [Planctomycetaceae bacterium]